MNFPCSLAEFNEKPIESLKLFENQLCAHSFFEKKVRIKCSDKSIDFNKPLAEQFNIFKLRSYEITPNVLIIDVKVGIIKGCWEDEFYIQEPEIVEICRRGLCISFDKAKKQQRILRLGLKKFFYMNQRDFEANGQNINNQNAEKSIEFDLKNESNKNLKNNEFSSKNTVFKNSKKPIDKNKESDKNQPKNDQADEKTKRLTIDVITGVLNKNIPIKMTGTSKLNGENLQIGFDIILNSWIICSKNVTLITKEFENLDLYNDNPAFIVALRIAKFWKQELSNLNLEQVNKIKKVLGEERLILIGEICGDIAMKHIVHYEIQSLFFYTVSKNEFGQSCLNPKLSYEIITKLGLKCIPPLFEVIINDLNEMPVQISNTIDEINRTSYDIIGEGVVLYFSYCDDNSQSFLLSKVKSYEYVLFRKLRETFKRFVCSKKHNSEDENQEEEQVNILQSDKKKLLISKKEEKIENDYFAHGFKINKEKHWKLIEFLPTIEKYKNYLDKKSTSFYEFFFYQIINFLREDGSTEKMYGNYSCFLRAVYFAIENNTCLNLKNIDKIIDTVKSMQVRFNKISPHIKIYPNVLDVKISKASSNLNFNSQKHVKIVIPLTVLGTGKSFLMNKLVKEYENRGFVTFFLSSDELSWFLIEKAKFKENDYDDSKDYFAKTRSEYRDQWNGSIDYIFERILHVNSSKFCILIDKNHHPFHFSKIRKGLEEKLESIGLSYDFVNIFIAVKNPLYENKLFSTELSSPLNFKIFFDSLVRMDGRTDNVLMKGTPLVKNLEILFDFFSFYVNYKIFTYKNSKNVFIKFYNENSESLNTLIDQTFGHLIIDYLKNKKSLPNGGVPFLKNFLSIFNDFRLKNAELIKSFNFPTDEEFDQSVFLHSDAFFSFENLYKPNNDKKFIGIKFSAIFFDQKIFEAKMKKIFDKIHLKIIQDKSAKKDLPKEIEVDLLKLSENGIDKSFWNICHPHLTCLYLDGKQVDEKMTVFLEKLEKIDNFSIELSGFVYIPKVIGFFTVSLKQKELTVNKVPHVSLFKNSGSEFVDSNKYGEFLLNEGGVLESSDFETFVHKKMKIDEKESSFLDVYFFKLENTFVEGRFKNEYL